MSNMAFIITVSMIAVDTKNILFICGGAFDGIEQAIAHRLNKSFVGAMVRAISVLPVPVGPTITMLLFSISTSFLSAGWLRRL